MAPVLDPMVGRYVRLDIDGTPHRLYFEEAGSGIPLVCLLAWGLAGGTFRLAWGQLPAPQPDAAPAETEVEEADEDAVLA